MYRPNGLRLGSRTTDYAGEFLGYYDDEPRTDLIWKVMMAMFAHPFPDLMKDVSFISINIHANSEMPFRAITKKPILLPIDKSYRLCPNFPELCVNKAGDVRYVTCPDVSLDHLCVWFGQVGKFYLTRIPGVHHPQFVSHFQIYGDAWCDSNPHIWEAYHYQPRNLEPSDFRPENIKPVSRYRPGYRSHAIANYRELSLSEDQPSCCYSPSLYAALKKQFVSDAVASREEYGCYYAGSQSSDGSRVLKMQDGVTCADWYYNRYWAICVWHKPTDTVVVATSHADLHRRIGMDAKTARWMRYNQKKSGDDLVFLL